MATRSQIHYYGAGKLFTQYCHYDGYIEGVGQTLYTHYQEPSKIKQLIALGALSTLGERVNPTTASHNFDNPEEGVTVAYRRDRGESVGVETTVHRERFKHRADLFNYINNQSPEEYSYIYIVGENRWYVIDHYSDDESLKSGVLLSKALGISEPEPQTAKAVVVKPKTLVTRQESVSIARKLKNNHQLMYVVFKIGETQLHGQVIKASEFSNQQYLMHVNWEDYVKFKQGGRPTQTDFADIIYKHVNYEYNKYLTQ